MDRRTALAVLGGTLSAASDSWGAAKPRSLAGEPQTENPRKTYQAEWASLDSRPIPAWFDHDKIGIFITWGVYSVPAIAWVYPDKPYGWGGHSCWYGMYVDRIYPLKDPREQAKLEAFHRKTFGNIDFREMAPLFKAEVFDPQQWAELFKKSGARWALMTSNFHDGYCTWPSPYSPGWNSVDVGPKRDLLGDFSAALRSAGLRNGIYYSLAEYTHPLYPKPESQKPQGDLRRFVRDHLQPQLREVIKSYAPSVIYFDGEWDYPEDSFEMKPFLAWLYNESPPKDDIVINDRFFAGSRGKHGGIYSSEVGIQESGTGHKWCEDRPISLGNWSYNRLERLEDHLSDRDMIHLLVDTVSKGGNIQWSVSPCADGTIPLLQQERLVQMGEWLKTNGEAIYGTTMWSTTHEGSMVETHNPHLDKDWNWTLTKETPKIHYTRKGNTLYAICLAWPVQSLKLEKPHPTRETEVRMLGYERPLKWKTEADYLVIDIPPDFATEAPSRHAWVFKLTGLGNLD